AAVIHDQDRTAEAGIMPDRDSGVSEFFDSAQISIAHPQSPFVEIEVDRDFDGRNSRGKVHQSVGRFIMNSGSSIANVTRCLTDQFSYPLRGKSDEEECGAHFYSFGLYRRGLR